MAKKDKKTLRIVESGKRQAGIRREIHFESGGTVEAWRGIGQVIPDKRKKKNKGLCRSKIEDE